MLVRNVMQTFERACPDSTVTLQGSLAAGTADAYSDIDLAWVVPDGRVHSCAESVAETLRGVQEVASIRSDPAFQRSQHRRLVYIRFANLPLFWRLDLQVWARSVAFDDNVDVDNLDVRGGDWSPHESAIMNAIAAIKALRRGQPDTASGLLDRGYARISAADPKGPWLSRVVELAERSAAEEPRLLPLAREVEALGRQLL